MIRLYEFPPTRSIRPRWMLQELEVPFESVEVNLMKQEHLDPEFLRVNPAGRLPALVDGDVVIAESVAISLYLAEKYADKGFFPKALAQRAELYKWLFFTATELEQPLWRMARHSDGYPEADRRPEEIPLASSEFVTMARVLDKHMQGREFLVGDTATVGDFVLAYTLDWANEVKLLAEFPTLQRYMERLYARPRAAMRIAQAFALLQQ